jgi:hypothetical protein
MASHASVKTPSHTLKSEYRRSSLANDLAPEGALAPREAGESPSDLSLGRIGLTHFDDTVERYQLRMFDTASALLWVFCMEVRG